MSIVDVACAQLAVFDLERYIQRDLRFEFTKGPQPVLDMFFCKLVAAAPLTTHDLAFRFKTLGLRKCNTKRDDTATVSNRRGRPTSGDQSADPLLALLR